MSILSNVESQLAGFAEEAVALAISEGKELIGKVATDIEDAFEDLVSKIGDLATKRVTALFSDDSLKGVEKANLAATQVAQDAADRGITVAEHELSALIKNTYLAVKDAIAKL